MFIHKSLTAKNDETIRSRRHDVGSERINKTALSADDDKRIILEDGIHRLTIGHHKS